MQREVADAVARCVGDDLAGKVLARLAGLVEVGEVESAAQRSERYLGHLECETFEEALTKAIGRGASDGEIWAIVRRVPWTSQELLSWADALPRTRGGASRATRLECCGVAFVAQRGGKVGWARRGCRDRLCPMCSALKSRAIAARVREHVAKLQTERIAGRSGHGPLLFVTLTQPKERYEEPRKALDRLFASWRRFRKCKLFTKKRRKNGEVVLPMIRGGLRTVEVTARPEGWTTGEGARAHRVDVPGIHAHIHVIVELEPFADEGRTIGECARDIIAWWVKLSGANPAAIDVQLLSDDRVYQACKYATDFAGLADLQEVAPRYVLKVLQALAGRRLCEPWGSWRGVLREESGDLRYSDTSVAGLVMGVGQVRWPSGDTMDSREVMGVIVGSRPLGIESGLEDGV